MWLVVVVFLEPVDVVESWVVALEGLEESLYFALRCRFSSGTEHMFDSMLLAQVAHHIVYLVEDNVACKTGL
jgi:hypothetical protein